MILEILECLEKKLTGDNLRRMKERHRRADELGIQARDADDLSEKLRRAEAAEKGQLAP